MMLLMLPAMWLAAGCGGKSECECDACEAAFDKCDGETTCEDAAVALCGDTGGAAE